MYINITSVGVILITCVILYVGLGHLLLYIRGRKQKELLSFSAFCLAAVFYNVFSILLYNAKSLAEGAPMQRAQLAIASIQLILLTWFISNFIKRKDRRLDIVFYCYGIILLALFAFDRSSFTFPNVPAIRHIYLFNTHVVSYYALKPGIAVILLDLSALFSSIYIISSLIKFYKKEKNSESLAMLIGIIGFYIIIINDVLVGLHVYNFIYILEYAYLFMLLSMGYALSTRRLKTRSKLQSSQKELQLLATAVNEAAESIEITDNSGAIIYVNPSFEKMTGYSKEEVQGRNPRILRSGKHSEQFYKNMWSDLTAGKTWRGNFINRKKDGALFEEYAAISPVHDEKGDITCYVAVKRDVTQEVMLEDQLRYSQKMEAIGQLAGKVAHDFTNVLVVILGNIQILQTRLASSSDNQEYIEEIINSANRASSMTAELLAFAHRSKQSLRVMNFNKAVRGVENLLIQTVGRFVDLSIITSDSPIKVNIDHDKIEQVLVQLTINANEATVSGGNITIETSKAHLSVKESAQLQDGVREIDRKDQDYAVLHISDNGKGMANEEKVHAFEPLFTTKEGKSTGLGLSTAYGIITQHKGQITIYSKPGVGTVFTIFLPLHDSSEDMPNDTLKIKSLPGKDLVLLVEDDPMIRDVLTDIIQQLGLQARIAESTEQAESVSESADSRIALLITNIFVNDKNTMEWAGKLKKKHPNIKIVYSSNFPVNHLSKTKLIKDNNPVITAPFTLQFVHDILQTVLLDQEKI
ncbi:PAS domain S-box protein [Verrucomicrobiota bacterium]